MMKFTPVEESLELMSKDGRCALVVASFWERLRESVGKKFRGRG